MQAEGGFCDVTVFVLEEAESPALPLNLLWILKGLFLHLSPAPKPQSHICWLRTQVEIGTFKRADSLFVFHIISFNEAFLNLNQ